MSDDDSDATGEAPPGEGSQQDSGEAKGKSGENRIPMSRVNEIVASKVGQAIAEFSARIEPMMAELRTLKSNKPPEPTKPTFSKAQLADFVDQGKFTQEAADTIWDDQLVARAKREAVAEARGAIEQGNLQRNVAEQTAEFQALVPDAWQVGTPERAAVEKAYNGLKATGLTGTKEQMELQALKTAFGDAASLRKARGFGKNGPAESFEDSGSFGARRREGGDDAAEGKPRGLTSKQDAYYSAKIASGMYKDWSAVRSELKFASGKRA